MYTLIIVVLSLFSGAGLLGFALFLFHFYRQLTRMTAAIDTLNSLVSPLAQGTALTDILGAAKKTAGLGSQVVASVTSLAAAFNTFNALVVGGKSAKPVEDYVEAGQVNPGDAFAAPTDADMAQREMEEQLRKAGVPVGEEPPEEPGVHQMNGASV